MGKFKNLVTWLLEIVNEISKVSANIMLNEKGFRNPVLGFSFRQDGRDADDPTDKVSRVHGTGTPLRQPHFIWTEHVRSDDPWRSEPNHPVPIETIDHRENQEAFGSADADGAGALRVNRSPGEVGGFQSNGLPEAGLPAGRRGRPCLEDDYPRRGQNTQQNHHRRFVSEQGQLSGSTRETT